MKIRFNFFHESPKPKNAENAVRYIKNRSELNFEIIESKLYLNKGSVVECSIEISADNWAEFVLEVIQFGQSVGSSWSITGKVEKELLMTTDRAILNHGVTMIDISVVRSEFESNYD